MLIATLQDPSSSAPHLASCQWALGQYRDLHFPLQWLMSVFCPLYHYSQQHSYLGLLSNANFEHPSHSQTWQSAVFILINVEVTMQV